MNVAQSQGVSIAATVYPGCVCGRPYAQHSVAGCAGYRPVRPVEHLGTRAFVPPASLGWSRRRLCRMIWAVEYRLQGWRERLARMKGV